MLVFVHGHPGQKSNWKYLVGYFEGRFRVVAYDMRGYGSSDKPLKVTLEDHVEDLHALLEELGIQESKAVVVGHSLGGVVAQEYAARYSVGGLVLVGSLTRLDAGLVDKLMWYLPAPIWKKLFYTHNPLTRRLYKSMFFSEESSEEVCWVPR